ncbi:hypothetical protein [Mycobacterium marinum]|uniref:hypothetical protein n=1 Tax=Mycobacterium marinum TaxID=1781 RepID=UPI0019204F0C|nr:hypothetical protein [Mycobacterium marinum]QQW33199.1 hypothetical protein HXW97_04625 [Mycobacterium marinum]
MTFIQTLLTPEFALQVSDRRLSAAGKIYDDSYNKAVSWCNMVTVSFTGAFAHVDHQMTEPVTNWIAGVLASQDTVQGAVNALSEGVKRLTSRMSALPDRRLTISMAGIAPDAGTVFCIRISNYETPDRILPKHSNTEVYRSGYNIPIGGIECHYSTAGAQLGDREVCANEVNKLARISQWGGINNTARYMVKLQRRVAERERRNGTNIVGNDAMVVSIPANDDHREGIFMSSTATDAIHGLAPNFSFVKSGSFSKERFAPVFACAGTVSTVSATGDRNYQKISFQFIDPPT